MTIGTVDLAAGADTLWVRIVQQGGDSPWPYGFGLLSWQSLEGRELGTAKVYGHLEGETYRLGNGLSPVERRGLLVFEPRMYNLRWLKASGAVWNLAFEVESGVTAGAGVGGFAGGYVSQGLGLELARVVFP
ncbi:MAG: hypothetical protein ACO29V_12550 [Limnohabitans sp.]